MEKTTPVFILAGGLGTRISEETILKPKPMVEIGDIPVLVHLMRWYYSFGFDFFVICAGYRSWEIKEYFLSYEFRSHHMRVDHRENPKAGPVAFGSYKSQERWCVDVVETGLETQTGGRLARAIDETSHHLDFTDFAVTYGDGLSDVDLAKEWAFHQSHGDIGTVLGVPPPARFGELDVDEEQKVAGFLEKPQFRSGLINGGFFFFKKEFRNYLSTDVSCIMERQPLTSLVSDSQLRVFPHSGFWQPMDTLRDKNALQAIWDSGKAPWLAKSEKQLELGNDPVSKITPPSLSV